VVQAARNLGASRGIVARQLLRAADLCLRYAEPALRRCIASGATVPIINAIHDRLPLVGKLVFADYYRETFQGSAISRERSWSSSFLGNRVTVPLRPATIALDWRIAVSLLASDWPVIRTYEAFLRSAQPPKLFVDAGANFGTHSLLMARAGLDVVSFEPNPGCRAYSQTLYEENGVTVATLPVALGARQGTAELVFPKGESWLGSIIPQVIGWNRDRGECEVVQTEVRRLDDVPLGGGPMLIKIDVEGGEVEVLEGARRTLRERRPAVIFESTDTMAELSDYFAGMGYEIHELPFDPRKPGEPLRDVKSARGPNYIAVSRA
jgi:FkbM family methyltransferase